MRVPSLFIPFSSIGAMNKSDLTVAALRVPLDFSMIVAAAYAAYFLRFQTFTVFRPISFVIPFKTYIFYSLVCAACTVAIFAYDGLYTLGRRKIQNEIQKIITACSTSIMLLLVLIFFRQEFFNSRFIVLAVWILGMVFVTLGRFALRSARYILFRQGIGLHGVVLIGPNEQSTQFERELLMNVSLGYRVCGRYTQFDESCEAALTQAIKNNNLDEIIVLNTKSVQDSLLKIIDFAELNHIDLRYSADLMSGKRLAFSTIMGIPLVEIKRTKLDGWGKILKRFFDVLISLFLIILSTPLLLIAALAVCLESRGPVIYRNIRVGPRGNFEVYKFRSMYQQYCIGPQFNASGTAENYELSLAKTHNERKGPIFKILNDPRRTRVGRILERTSIDELPQLLNVLLGNMSLVGPRPHLPIQVAGYQRHHHQLFFVKPGITGLAQISGRSELDFEEEARLDIYYVENWSFLLDLIILLKTPWAVLMRKSRV